MPKAVRHDENKQQFLQAVLKKTVPEQSDTAFLFKVGLLNHSEDHREQSDRLAKTDDGDVL